MIKKMGEWGNLLKQAKEIKAKLNQIQEELGKKKVEATAGGGMVTVVANGRQEILKIKIEQEIVNSRDIEMLEDLILSAVNEARRKGEEIAKEEMHKVAGPFNLPGLFT